MHEEKVLAGVAWLDEHKPDWREDFDGETLDMADPNRCVFAQVFRSEFENNRDLYAVTSPFSYALEEFPEIDPEDLGFDLVGPWSVPRWRALGAEWIAYLDGNFWEVKNSDGVHLTYVHGADSMVAAERANAKLDRSGGYFLRRVTS
jgi:hypothetical protein